MALALVPGAEQDPRCNSAARSPGITLSVGGGMIYGVKHARQRYATAYIQMGLLDTPHIYAQKRRQTTPATSARVSPTALSGRVEWVVGEGGFVAGKRQWGPVRPRPFITIFLLSSKTDNIVV